MLAWPLGFGDTLGGDQRLKFYNDAFEQFLIFFK